MLILISGNKQIVKNYHPILLQPTLCKILEKHQNFTDRIF